MDPNFVLALLQLLRAALEEAAEDHLVCLLFPLRLPERPPGGQVPSVPTDTAEKVFGVLVKAEKPLKGRTVAHRAGLGYGSHLRQTLSDLVLTGRLMRVPGRGYWPAGKPVPPADQTT
jgi:hypothetical protein